MIINNIITISNQQEDLIFESTGIRSNSPKIREINKQQNNILNNKKLPIYGKGKNSREWIHVYDHCEALIKVFKNGKYGEFYNIGSNKNLNNIQIAKLLLKVASKIIKIKSNVKIYFVKDRPGHDLRYALDSKKISKKLNWSSSTKLESGLKKTFLWYLQNISYYKLPDQ